MECLFLLKKMKIKKNTKKTLKTPLEFKKTFKTALQLLHITHVLALMITIRNMFEDI